MPLTNPVLFGFAVSNTTQGTSGTVGLSNFSFAGAGGASVGVSNGSIVVSAPPAGGATGALSLGMSNLGNTSGTSGTVSSQYVFVGTNNITLSQSVNGQSATLTISGPATGGIVAGVSTGGNTAGSTGTVSTGPVVFVGSKGITLSQSTGAAGASATITILDNAITLSGHSPFHPGARFALSQLGNATWFVQPAPVSNAFQFDRFVAFLHNTNATNSSGSHTISVFAALYTRNASTLSLLMSSSGSTAVTHSGTQGSYSQYSGLRQFTFGWTSTVSASNYWIGIMTRTSTAGTDGTYSQLCLSGFGTNLSGPFGAANNATNQWNLGQGSFSASSAGAPGAIAFSEINGSGDGNLRVPIFQFMSVSV